MDISVMRQVPEAIYLSTQDTKYYRAILRYMYEQHRIFNNDVLPVEIYTYLQQFPEFGDYTIEKLDGDLSVLVGNKNLILNQDNTDAATLEDLIKNRKTYSLTEYTIEFEKTLIFWKKAQSNSRRLPRQKFNGTLVQCAYTSKWIFCFGGFGY
ncbi:DUF2397 family protein [Paenibacillus sp. RC67]|uniref:DUF2397 family protein n=1 Tax=Paenibacillus sp. RC67 TaxID=3039392 RepID=UPI0024AD7006|nr:DUF2397 family protein [Paenibacillus sp. RC67]